MSTYPKKGVSFFFDGNPGDGMRKKVAFLPKACIGPGPTLTYEDDSIVLARERGGGAVMSNSSKPFPPFYMGETIGVRTISQRPLKSQ